MEPKPSVMAEIERLRELITDLGFDPDSGEDMESQHCPWKSLSRPALWARIREAEAKTDVYIEHDPDSGCANCPFRRVHCRLAKGTLTYPNHLADAPHWCPLRTARVVVQRPGGEG